MKARLKKPLIAALALLVLLGLGAAVYMLMPAQAGGPLQISINIGNHGTETPAGPSPEQPSPPPQTSTKPSPGRPTPVPAPPPEGILLPVGTKVINLADPGGYRYLKTSIVLEFEPEDPKFTSLKGEARLKKEEEMVKELKSRTAVYEDIITTLLSSKTFEEVFTIQGKEHLKAEIKERINTRLGREEVLEVYFTEFVIQ